MHILRVTTRVEWHIWLESHFATSREVWLAIPHKGHGTRISYNDSVEEALCFGWIDSIVRNVDPHTSVQRFTPRSSPHYSQANKERLHWLMQHNMVHPSLHAQVAEVLKPPFVFPPDILEALKESSEVWNNWQHFSPAYQRIRVAYVAAARKRPHEFVKRLRNLIIKTKANKQIGYGGIDKYY